MRGAGVEIDVCPRCQGTWLAGGELKHFPNHAALRPYLAQAKQAPSRCRKQGHQIPRAMVACATCRGAPLSCPACGARLGLVATSTCTIDVCSQCEGVWLDAGELEPLRNVAPASRPEPKRRNVVAAASDWEVAEATDTGGDPWKGAGASRALEATQAVAAPVVTRSPLGCNHCGITVMAHRAWAYDGEIYCETCKPAGAVSGKGPKDPRIRNPDIKDPEDAGSVLLSWVIGLFR
jgi:Zn-finger nucleic acid-binding protein